MMQSLAENDKSGIAVVIPCYRVADHILGVIEGIGDEVDAIIVVDDACPEKTADLVESECRDQRVAVVRHDRNQGVGGATLTGYRKALETGCKIIVKLDGDGQMDASLIPTLVKPILRGQADYTKGNRFYQLEWLSGMPLIRIFGNLTLSFITKISSGYWDIFDPTNGYTAIHADVANQLPFEKISHSYFFESDMLFRLNILRAVVTDIPMAASYGDERSNLSILKIIPEFLYKHAINAFKRTFYAYFLRDFNIASIELVIGSVLLVFGFVYGGMKWLESINTGVPATAGTAVLAALAIILGSQMLIAFLNYDINSTPKSALHKKI